MDACAGCYTLDRFYNIHYRVHHQIMASALYFPRFLSVRPSSYKTYARPPTSDMMCSLSGFMLPRF